MILTWLPGVSLAQHDSDAMCLVRQPDALALAKAEHAQQYGRYNDARHSFEKLATSKVSAIAARAAFRIAEIDEELRWASDASSADILSLLQTAHDIRIFFLNVTKADDAFWSRRAAYRILCLVDDLIGRLQDFVSSAPHRLALSPFSVLFAHTLMDASFNKTLEELLNERRALEESLLHKLTPSADFALYTALKARLSEGMSPYFDQVLTPPWDNALPAGLIVKRDFGYYRLSEAGALQSLTRPRSIALMREALKQPQEPITFAFALAQLIDEKQAIPASIVISALQSNHSCVRLAALYAAQKSPSHEFTPWLLKLWPHGHTAVLFSSAQRLLFGERERVLLALSTHFALGRRSTQLILASHSLPDEEKAWLLQFRRDKHSVVYADAFLRHQNKLVKRRTTEAIEAWNS